MKIKKRKAKKKKQKQKNKWGEEEKEKGEEGIIHNTYLLVTMCHLPRMSLPLDLLRTNLEYTFILV